MSALVALCPHDKIAWWVSDDLDFVHQRTSPFPNLGYRLELREEVPTFSGCCKVCGEVSAANRGLLMRAAMGL